MKTKRMRIRAKVAERSRQKQIKKKVREHTYRRGSRNKKQHNYHKDIILTRRQCKETKPYNGLFSYTGLWSVRKIVRFKKTKFFETTIFQGTAW